ncbi:GNAT family N-acetyltransferase [Dactylosporangium sp. AC04546]|uniref:GNAT family N-acetyltransferase n=1 Tax=Dactylosporangium sp. AC04546 TaxID=2862460 RepID=UPI001EE140A1|nr:GNAT family N-acetyltransferase [Dactylosporangium sp. AC04546]WVK87123.1 GNAT family N-acetyltransferase [Dactylosporangium sp. AC04546]
MSAEVTYRPATGADVPSLYAVWAESFEAPHVIDLWAGDPGRLPRTFVAVEAATVVAAVYYLPRRLRDATGAADLVGGLANVATLPRARGRGHVRRLLDLALAAMTADGCAWSLLFTGTPGVYRGSGFHTFTLRYRSGRPAPRTAPPAGWTVDAGSPADWSGLAPIHHAFNAHRPLSTVRDADDWARRVPVWYAPPAELLLARRHGHVDGYLVLRHTGDEVRVAEAAVLPGRQEALRALFTAVADRARAAGARRVAARLPADPAIDAALPWLLHDPVTEIDDTGMLRPVHASPDHLAAMTAAPGAFHWPGDYL